MTRSSAPELIVRRSSFSHDETLQRLVAAIDARGATLFDVIDHAKNAAQAGLELPPTSFGDTYNRERDNAKQRHWPVTTLAGHHPGR